ncbi:MDR ABC transporter permease [Bacillus tequilensis]|nr:hypothetical protein [Bacillus tequilensis]SPT93382.1 MDR ABC transporter permease [Bacillus tequilensis]
MLSLFQNRWERILTKKAIIIITVIIVPLMVGVAIMFSGKPIFKETIAFVTEQDDVQHMPSDLPLEWWRYIRSRRFLIWC